MSVRMALLSLALLSLSLSLASALVCPDGGMCEDKNTCCKNTEGSYGCCPLPHAECCSDHLHCCYEGTVCDLVHSKCVNKTHSLPLVRRVPATQAPIKPQAERGVKAVLCPDKESECPDETTCCELLDGSWGCCPLAKAVCCEDHLHCCPEGAKCDITHSRCLQSPWQHVPMRKKLPARRREDTPASPVGSVTCPGEKSSCPDSYTCCLMTSGEYGCCPYPQASCCSDRLHCCPSNTECDMEHGVCKNGDNELLPMMKKILATANDVVCPDQKSSCPDQTTCCQMTNGSYGCCPMPNAVCCTDHVHCCPEDSKCDLEHSACVPARGEPILGFEIPNTPYTTSATTGAKASMELAALLSKVSAVPCNDSVACADGSTCCKTLDGDWACCPMSKAVCCDDHEHCCPHGTVCNLAESTCDDPSGSSTMPWLTKHTAFPLVTKHTALPLPTENSKCDKSTSCPGKSTCCKTGGGGWACCPLPLTLSDTMTTEPDTMTTEPDNLTDVKCDDQSSCASGTTCCKLQTGEWGCCPLVKAVCCDDHVHCCPNNTVCNLEAETCDDPSGLQATVPWVTKEPAMTSEVQEEKCDKQTMCPRGTTCCKKDSDQWACCPLPQAVCCGDHEHCCPKGYSCNVAVQTCDKAGQLSLPWVWKLPALKLNARLAGDDYARLAVDGNDHVKARLAVSGYARPLRNMCDAVTSCPKDTTCCFMERTQKWGCCPVPQAVCCIDGNHCCPSGHTCEPHRSSCSKGKHLISWFTKLSAMTTEGSDTDTVATEAGTMTTEAGIMTTEADTMTTEPDNLTDVKCDDESSCASGTTCCKLQTGEWGCCPLVKAVCCADQEHCCPQGYSCNMQTGTCEKTLVGPSDVIKSIPMTTVERSGSEPEVVQSSQYKPCDVTGESHCAERETCCKISAETWACCPEPGAVCCAEAKRCCPSGFSCNLLTGGCTLKQPDLTQLSWDSLLKHRKNKDFKLRL